MSTLRSAHILTILFTVFNGQAALADDVEIVECVTSIYGETHTLTYDLEGHWSGPNPWLYEHYTLREILFSGWGDFDCPSPITLAHMTPEFTHKERAEHCLIWDKENKTYSQFSKGKRKANGTCKDPRTICQRVADGKEEALAVIGVGGAVASAPTIVGATGVTAVTHSSGAAILTGSSGYVAGSLGGVAATSLSAIGAVVTAPVTIIAGSAVAATIGGATYYCWDELSANDSSSDEAED